MSVTKTPSARPILALIPLALLGLLVVIFIAVGPAGIFPGDFPPIEDLTVQRAVLHPDEIILTVTNGGPDEVTVSQVLVDDAYWEHTIVPSRTIGRLRTVKITIPYPWVEAEPVELTLVTSTGLTFSHSIEVATETPEAGGRFLLTFTLLGIYIGVVPVLLGMTWLPFLKTLSVVWLRFFMALTAGVLIFLGIETIDEAVEGASQLPTAFGGIGVVTVAAVGSFALILATSRTYQKRSSGSGRLVVAYALAAGIGLHNLGEGLAVGAAYQLGEIGLGAFLVIGFAIHNTTEGLGIVSVLGYQKTKLRTLSALGLIAGIPTIFGGWIGGFAFTPLLATVFLAVAAGAIAEVVVEVLRVIKEDGGILSSIETLGGLALGLGVMYATALGIAA